MPGIDNLKQAIASIIEFFVLIILIVKEKKGWWFIITKVAPKVLKLKKAILDNWDDIKVEYGDLDDEERATLNQYFKDTFDLDDDTAEQIAEAWWGWGLYTENTIRKTIELSR